MRLIALIRTGDQPIGTAFNKDLHVYTHMRL
jgi:hypothetical protein